MTFGEELRQQRWDDHRYYHHSRVNQSLHLVSACCFLASYALLPFEPAWAVFVGWLLAMVTRQTGHFWFEPKTYDEVNQVTHEYKESVKTGYNLRRKVVLLTIWALAPVALLVDPTFLGVFSPAADTKGRLDNLALLWMFIGFGAVVFRTVHLFFLQSVQTGLVWFTKILTDPFHDVWIYHRAPLHLWNGEWYDEMTAWYDESLVGERS